VLLDTAPVGMGRGVPRHAVPDQLTGLALLVLRDGAAWHPARDPSRRVFALFATMP